MVPSVVRQFSSSDSDAAGDQPLLLVEDEPVQQGFLHGVFAAAGYDVVAVGTVAAARSALAERRFVLAVLDLGLPDGTGHDLMPLIRQNPATGVIILTSRETRSDRILGLDLGADDYLIKPPDPAELLLRARNLVRRLATWRTAAEGADTLPDACRFGRWRADFAERLLERDDGSTSVLTPTEARLLRLLAERAGKSVKRLDILTGIGHGAAESNPRSIDWLILRLRRKLLDDAANPKIIVGVRGVGYRFVDKVTWER